MKKLEIVLIHGLNNSRESFYPFKRKLEKKGFVVHLFSLPGHRKIDNTMSPESAIEGFSKQFDKLGKRKKFVCIGFSQGGLMLQLLPDKIKKRIKKQILLAPALSVRKSFFLEKILHMLPGSLPLISLTPKELRKFEWLTVKYFDLLFKEISHFREFFLGRSSIPTMVLVDPKDELIDVSALKEFCDKQKNWKFSLIERPSMNFIHLGQYHVLFHPKYFEREQWNNLVTDIVDFTKD